MKIAFINGVCKHRDAISECVRGTIQVAQERLGADCCLFSYANDFQDLPFTKVESVSDVVLNPFFLDANLIIYDFGIYYELFNALLLGNGKAPQIARYHNVTPKELLPPKDHRLISKSLRQIANMSAADEVWAVSTFNAAHLKELGISEEKIRVSPLYVKPRFPALTWREKKIDQVRVLYVGRFVESKGVTDLLRAVAYARSRTETNFVLQLAGNFEFSDLSYISRIEGMIGDLGLSDVVQFRGQVDDDELARLLADAHIFAIASYHEGFCVPLIEAMSAACVPIAYAVGNVPDLVAKFGELVAPGDWRLFGERLLVQIKQCSNLAGTTATSEFVVGDQKTTRAEYGERLARHLKQFIFDAYADRLCSSIQFAINRPGGGASHIRPA